MTNLLHVCEGKVVCDEAWHCPLPTPDVSAFYEWHSSLELAYFKAITCIIQHNLFILLQMRGSILGRTLTYVMQ